MRKKLNISHLLSVIILLATTIGTSVTFMYNHKINKLDKISNSFYNKQSVYFYQTNDTIDYFNIYNSMSENMLLYNQLSTSEDIRGVIFKGNIDYPDLISGNFFSEKDFSVDKSKLAVVGKSVKTENVNGKNFYVYNGNYYEVTGIIGYDFPTKLDKTVLLTINNDLLYTNVQYIIYSPSTEKSYEFVNNTNIFSEVTILERDNSGILNVTKTGMSSSITTKCFMIILLVNSFVLIYFLIDKKHDEIIVLKINGFTNHQIYKSFMCEFITMSSVSVITGTILATILSVHESCFSLISLIIISVTLFFVFDIYFLLILRKEISLIKNIKAGDIE